MRATWIVFGAALALAGCQTAEQPADEPVRSSSEAQIGDTAHVDDANERDAEREVPFDEAVDRERALRDLQRLGDEEISPRQRTQIARESYLTGVRYLGNNDFEQAIRHFQTALEFDPLYYRAHFKLGICYFNANHYQLEIIEYRKCLTINPNFVPALLNLGHAHLVMDELEEARVAYERVLDHAPNDVVALFNKALVEYDLGNHDAALEHFERYLEQPTNNPQLRRRAEDYRRELEQKRR